MRTAKIPEIVLTVGMSPHALAVYIVLVMHRNRSTGTAWPTTATMTRLSGVGINTLKAKLAELTALGLIERVRKRKENVNEYHVYIPEPDSEKCEPEPEPDSQFCESDTPDQIHSFVEPDSQFCESPYKRTKKKNQSKRSASKSLSSKAKASSAEECITYAIEQNRPKDDGAWFFDSMEAGGWKRGGKPLADWKAHFRSYVRGGWLPSQKINGSHNGATLTHKDRL